MYYIHLIHEEVNHDTVYFLVTVRFVCFKLLTFPVYDLQEIYRRGLKIAVIGIPKTIDNDIAVSIYAPAFVTMT